jgi:hypothetical protein
MTTILLAIVALAIGGLSMLMLLSRRRRTLAVLNDRASLDDDAIYTRYYAEAQLPKMLVLQLWHEVADTLKVPAAKLRPEDRFGKEIGTYWITSDDLDALAMKGRNRAKSLGLTIDFEKINTVDAYIRCLAKTTTS